MKLLFKQRLLSWLDNYDIFDENGNTIFTVKGQLSWGHKLIIYTADETAIGLLQQEILTFMPKFNFWIKDVY